MPGGRPIEITQALISEIETYLLAGNYIETTANAVGINRDTFYDWLKKGARDKKAGLSTIYTEFSDIVKKSQAKAEVGDLAVIGAAAKREWQAAAWRLERKYPERYGRLDRIEASIRGRIDIHKARKDPPEIIELRKLLRAQEKKKTIEEIEKENASK